MPRTPPPRYWKIVLAVAVTSLALAIFLETGRWWWVAISVLAHLEMIYIAYAFLGQRDATFGYMTNESDTQPESTPAESTETPDQNVEADQVVINNAPDGGGVDNEAEAPAEESDSE